MSCLPGWQAPTFEPSAGTMSIEDVNDLLGVEPRWWRARKEWHLGWADHNLWHQVVTPRMNQRKAS